MRTILALLILFFNSSLAAQNYEGTCNCYTLDDTDGLPSNFIHVIYKSNDTLFVGTDLGLAISTNEMSFTNILPQRVNEVVVSNGVIYAASASGLNISTNGGKDFVNRGLDHGLPSRSIRSIFVYDEVIYAGTSQGLAISTDGGMTFTNRTTHHGLLSNSIRDIVVSDEVIYVATQIGLSVSIDGGDTFSTKISNKFTRTVRKIDDVIYVVTSYNGLGISMDGGDTFEFKTLDDESNRIRNIYVLNEVIYAGTENGLFLSMDGGDTFTKVTNSGDGWVTKLIVADEVLYMNYPRLTICGLEPSITGRDTTICEGQEIDLNDLVAGITINPLVFGTSVGNYDLVNSTMQSPTGTTTYYVRDSNRLSNCVDTAKITVKVNPLPNSPTIERNDATCTYSYIPGNLGDSFVPNSIPTAMPSTNPEPFIVTVTNSLGCTENFTVDPDACPNVSTCLGIDLVIDQDTIQSSTYKATNTITSEGGIIKDSSVTFQAATAINLSPGFHAEKGSIFFAEIIDCSEEGLFNMEKERSFNTLIPIPKNTTPKEENISVKVYPNPFIDGTTIQVNLKKPEKLQISIHNLAGKQIQSFANNVLYEAGEHHFSYEGLTIQQSGFYFLSVKTPQYHLIQKILYMSL